MTSCSRTWLHKVPDNSCLLTNGFHSQVNLAEGAAVLGTYFSSQDFLQFDTHKVPCETTWRPPST